MGVFRYLKRYWWQICLVVLLTYGQVMANLQLPDFMAEMVNNGILQKDTSVIYRYGWLMLLVSLAGAMVTVAAGLLAARVAAGFARDVRRDAFRRIQTFSSHEFSEFSTASLLTRSTNDIQQLQMTTVQMLRMMLIAPFMAIGALQKALSNAIELSWILVVAVGIVSVVIVVMMVIVLPRFRTIQAKVDKLNLVARENLTGLRVVRAFHKEKYEEHKFEQVNTDLTKLNIFVNRVMMAAQPLMTLVLNGVMLAVIWFGAHLVASNAINIGNMMAFIQYGIQAIMSFLMASIIFIIVPRAMISARRVNEVLTTTSSVQNPKNPETLPKNLRGVITFRHVDYSYKNSDEPVLHDISFTANPGETTAIIGSTGSGKSTLVNLIPRLFDATSGNVLFDGVDVRQLKQSELRSHIGFIPQKATLFSGTVRENVTYGTRNATDALVHKSLAVAQADEFVNGLPKKEKSHIAQGGANLSGGQKQRLSIARALVKQPLVYVFDDAFSALDLKTDQRLRAALAPLTKKNTVIIVAQRISTILHADKIIVLDQGKIVGEGAHNDLIKTCDVYQEIVHSQLSDTELNGLSDEEVSRG